MIYYDNNKIIGKAYIGATPVRKMYGGGSLAFNNGIENGGGSEPSLPYQYAIVNDITNYTDTDYIDVYDRKTMKWYKLNNLNEYEGYGIYGDSRQNTYYAGKLVVEGNAEYEWNGTEWVYVGEADVSGWWYAPTDDEIMDAGYGNDICESGFTKYRFTISAPATSMLRFANQACYPMGIINVTGPWEVGVTYDAGQTLYIPRGSGIYEILGRGFEFGDGPVTYAKEYAAKERPMFAKAYDTLALAEADKGNVGLNTAAVLPNNNVYTFSADGSLVATLHYKMVGRLNDTVECLYEPSSDDKVVTSGWTSYLYKTKLLNVIIDDATSIGNDAFSFCSSLTRITIPSSVTSIGGYAFFPDPSLESITSLATTAPTIQSTTFQGVKTNGTLRVPQGSTGYNVWMGTGNYYLGKYNWTKVEQ